jgi:hypothetical protein
MADRSCARAVTHLSLCVEDAHSQKKDIVHFYLDFKRAFPATNHEQLVRVLEFLGLPNDFTRLVSNLNNGASTEFATPTGTPHPWGSYGAPSKATSFPLFFFTSWSNCSYAGSRPLTMATTSPLVASKGPVNGTLTTAHLSQTK